MSGVDKAVKSVSTRMDFPFPNLNVDMQLLHHRDLLNVSRICFLFSETLMMFFCYVSRYFVAQRGAV